MAVYRFLAYDLRTNALLQELPLSVKSFSDTLNGIGSFSAKLPVPDDPVLARAIISATIPERTVVFVERDGVLLHGYIIWQRRRKPERAIELAGTSLTSILRRNRIVSTLTYTATEQLTIAAGILAHVQSQAGADFDFATAGAASGVLRDRTYNGYERKNAWDALVELAACDDGFDFGLDVAWSAGDPAKTITLSYPRRGRIAGTTGIIFETGKNITDYDFLEDGTRSARAVDGFGAGDGNDMLMSTAVDTALLDAGYPLTADSISHKDVIVQATIDAHTRDALRARAGTPTFLTIEIDPADVEAGLGSFIVGDDAYVAITDRHFPRQDDGSPGYSGYHRILAYNVKIPEAGPERVLVTAGSIL